MSSSHWEDPLLICFSLVIEKIFAISLVEFKIFSTRRSPTSPRYYCLRKMLLYRHSSDGLLVACLLLTICLFNVNASPVKLSESQSFEMMPVSAQSGPTGKIEDCKGSVGFYSEIAPWQGRSPKSRWGVVLDCKRAYRTTSHGDIEYFGSLDRTTFPAHIIFVGIKVNRDRLDNIGEVLRAQRLGDEQPENWPLQVWQILKSDTFSKDVHARETSYGALLDWMGEERKKYAGWSGKMSAKLLEGVQNVKLFGGMGTKQDTDMGVEPNAGMCANCLEAERGQGREREEEAQIAAQRNQMADLKGKGKAV
ncbi:hypothetical protein F5880DRAFT_1549458, partial [Lentinula raphanica]